MRVARGIWSRRGDSLAAFLVTTFVVAGCFAVVAYARLVDASWAFAAGLLLLGVAALVVHTAASVRSRRSEICLARLRGEGGLRLLLLAVTEPMIVVVLAAVVGTLLGRAAMQMAVRRWLGQGTSFDVSTPELVAVGAVTICCLLVVTVTSWPVLHEPLVEQLQSQNRPRATSSAVLFVQIVLIIGAVVAVYQARHSGPAEADPLSLASPAILGLAAGQIVVWLLMLVTRWVVRRRPSKLSSLGRFLTPRRLTRRTESIVVIRVVVAVGVLAGLAVNASAAAGDWRDETARVAVGAPLQFPVDDGPLPALAATEQADPDGRWLMAVAAFADASGGAYRRVFVDTARWRRVVGGFFSDTSVAAVTDHIDELPSGRQLPTTSGHAFTAVVSRGSLAHARGVDLTLSYVNDSGTLRSQTLYLSRGRAAPAGQGMVRFEQKVDDCTRGCLPQKLAVHGRTRHGSLHVVQLRFAGANLLAPDGVPRGRASQKLAVHAAPRGVELSLRIPPGREAEVKVAHLHALGGLTGIATPTTSYEVEHGYNLVYAVNGDSRAVQVAATVPTLPFVGNQGTLMDLRQSLLAGANTIPAVDAMVLARADTPDSILGKLRATGVVGSPRSFTAALAHMEDSPKSQGIRLYVLLAFFAALIAIVSVLASTAQQLRARRQEAASLRAVGVSGRDISRGYRWEAAVIGSTVLLGTGAATWGCCRLLMGTLPLVAGGKFSLAVDTTPRAVVLVVVSAAAAVLVAATLAAILGRVGRVSRPSLLRDAGER